MSVFTVRAILVATLVVGMLDGLSWSSEKKQSLAVALQINLDKMLEPEREIFTA